MQKKGIASRDRLWSKIAIIVLFGVAFGLVEAVIVLYLRTLNGGSAFPDQSSFLPSQVLLDLGLMAWLKPQTSVAFFYNQHILHWEMMREAATMVMLLSVAWLTGKRWSEWLSYYLLVFGIWDLSYYGWLQVLSRWPNGWLTGDVLFLLPIPWVAPVVTPITISALMVVGAVWWLQRSNKEGTVDDNDDN